MAKKAYVGVNGVARNVKNIYVGVNGVARKVVKGYVGVNGVARLFWDGGGSSVIPSWDSWASKAGNTNNPDITIASTKFYKRNNKIAYFAMAVLINERWIEQRQFTSHAIYISPDADATAFDYYASGTTHYTAQTSVVDKNNMLWYICYFPQALQFTIPAIRPAECVLNTTDNPYYYDTTYDPETPSHNKKPMVDAIQEAALDLIDRIYAYSNTDYEVGQTYTLEMADVTKTIRKVVGIYLYRLLPTLSQYGAEGYDIYMLLSDNVDDIISNIVDAIYDKGTENGLIQVDVISQLGISGQDNIKVSVYHGTSGSPIGQVTQLQNAYCRNKTSTYGYQDWEFYASEWTYAKTDWITTATITKVEDPETGELEPSITYRTTANSSYNVRIDFITGLKFYQRYTGTDEYVLTNLGIDL